MTSKRQLTLHVDADIAAAIEVEANRRGLNLSRAANDALRRALIDETGNAVADTVRARLDRLDKRDAARAHELALIKEILLLFVRTWFERTGDLPDDDPDASANAGVRFQGFLEMLAGEGARAASRLSRLNGGVASARFASCRTAHLV